MLEGLLLLLFGLSLHAFRHGLRREPFAVDAVNSIADEEQVFGDEQGVGREKREEGDALLGGRGQLGHNLYAFAPFARQLVGHVEGADGVNVVAEEIDAERVFAAEAEHVEDGAAQCKLPRLVDIVHLVEAELAQLRGNGGRVHLLSLFQRQRALVHLSLRDDQFSQSLGIADDETAAAACRAAAQHLRAQNFVGCVALRIFDGAAVGRGVEQHQLVAQHLRQVVVEIAGLLLVVEHEQRVAQQLSPFYGGKQHRCGRACQSVQMQASDAAVAQILSRSIHLWGYGKEFGEVFYLHSSL